MGISFNPENLLVLRGKFSFITLGLVGGLINVNFLDLLKHIIVLGKLLKVHFREILGFDLLLSHDFFLIPELNER